MYRFYVDSNSINDKSIVIQGPDVNHIRNVLRMRQGEHLVINDMEGTDYYCLIDEISSDEVQLSAESCRPCEAELKTKLVLFQALPKLDKMELIIQKAVELGVCEIVPVITNRCVVKLDSGARQERKLERWQSIAKAAAKQSARGIIPVVHEPLKYIDAVEMSKTLDYTLIPYEHAAGMVDARNCMDDAATKESVGIFIGPEGGFEDEEIRIAKESGAHVISLGNRILRTETAGMTVLSILMFKLSQ